MTSGIAIIVRLLDELVKFLKFSNTYYYRFDDSNWLSQIIYVAVSWIFTWFVWNLLIEVRNYSEQGLKEKKEAVVNVEEEQVLLW